MDTKNQAHFPVPNAVLGDPNNPAIRAAADLVRVQNELGLSLSLRDANFNTIAACFNSMTDLLNSPEFISHLTQDLYISDSSDTQWFMMRLKKGRFSSITFLLMMKIYCVKIINKAAAGFDFLVVCYSQSEEGAKSALAVVPYRVFSPGKITQYFYRLCGETANDPKEVGKVLCFILSKWITDSPPDSLVFYSPQQGFKRFWPGDKPSGTLRFNPPRLGFAGFNSYLPPGLQNRQNPKGESSFSEDMTPILAPLFSGSKWLLIVLLFRVASWMQFLFARRDVYADNVIELKPTTTIPIPLLIAIMKNIRYDNLDAPPVGPNIKPLRFDLETVSDGVVDVVDTFAADQVKKRNGAMIYCFRMLVGL